MNDAGAEESPEEAMAEAEAMEQAAMEAAQAAATAMANWVQAVNRWQQVASTTSKKRRDAERQLASWVKQTNSRIQEMEKRMEEGNEGLVQTFSKEKKKLSIVGDEQSPRCLPVVDQQGTTTPELKPKIASLRRSGPPCAASDVHSVTPSKQQRILESDGTLKTPFPDSATQPTFSSSFPSPSFARPLDRRQTALLAAVKYGRMDDVVNYLEMGIDSNFWDEEGNTLLHVAAKNARSKVLNVLLTKGRLHVDAVASAGQTALHVAASSANGGTCVNILLKQKADVNKGDGKGDTPLHCAARNGHELIVKRLLVNGAVSNIANNDGEIPIHVANTDGVRHLIQSQILTSPPARELLDPSFFVSTSVDSANEINVQDGEIYLD